MTSNAIEFIRSGLFNVTTATCGRGRSTRTRVSVGSVTTARYRVPSLRLFCLGLLGDGGVDVELLELTDHLFEVLGGQHA